ncbi:type 1 glutamine amidotransferase domain-containing protein [Bacillus sp. FJAT-44742]|uniref:type 1 glutamine amidotransferase domain-containing protein n=1 Tax=Bacillus sp. FJAT-44742 TaxID=2014005 RepID=UPI002FCD5F44
MAKILMVTTSSYELNEYQKTGLWVSEFTEPYLEFKNAGHEVTVASAEGGNVPLDPNSLEEDAPEEWREVMKLLSDTPSVSEFNAKDFDGVFLPGGHGTMLDLPDNESLQSLLKETAEEDKAIGAVCHGPAGLVGVTLSDGTPLVNGKRVTSFKNDEEKEMKVYEKVPFLLESRLEELGATFTSGENFTDHVEVDGKLVTGQNPQSSIQTAKEFLNVLS